MRINMYFLDFSYCSFAPDFLKFINKYKQKQVFWNG